jgi:nitrile hydratase accessory protein
VTEVDRRIADLDDLPRKNGELVFEAPWQGRAFGMAVALNLQNTDDWEDFRQRLIGEIAHDARRDYYASWLGAFEEMLIDRRVLTPEELRHRTAEYRSMQRDAVDREEG